jgi:CheY-like chemotaxis protein
MQREHPLILVVNDDQSYLYLMHELLTDEQYEVILCATSDNACPLAEQHCPDLIMLDMRMEEPQSGLKILQMLRRNPLTRHIPVLMNSADHHLSTEQADQLQALHGQMVGQSLNLDDLLSAIRQHLAP